MRYIILLAATLLAGCQTTKSDIKLECVKADSADGVFTVCPMPANIVCIEKAGNLSCLQVQEPRSY